MISAPFKAHSVVAADGTTFRVRRAQPTDEAATYAVCLETGDNGQDATPLHDDPRALGNLYVGPYLHLAPELAFVAEDDAGVCGYVLGALDSEQFYAAYRTQWLPPLCEKFPAPTGDPLSWTLSQRLHFDFHHPQVYFPETFRPYPSHLHVDLLARAQGRGLGARMLGVLLDELRARRSPGVHLAMSGLNDRAFRFYQKLGFQELDRVGTGADETLFLCRTL